MQKLIKRTLYGVTFLFAAFAVFIGFNQGSVSADTPHTEPPSTPPTPGTPACAMWWCDASIPFSNGYSEPTGDDGDDGDGDGG